jgi:cytochrome c oxidase subunit 2
MWSEFSLMPEQASTMAHEVDALFFTLVALSVFFAGLIFLLILVFAIRYHRRSDDEQPKPILGDIRLELAWSLIPAALALGVFVWSTVLFFKIQTPPKDALEVYVVAKQWMWKLQHPSGKREINSLHIPLNQPVRLTMTSEDVIHDFFVPAFRVKMDVLPGKYTSMWFEATKPGTYHLFCAEYCGTEHSKMIGSVVAMDPADYEAWLEGGQRGETMAQAGERLFHQYACQTCHKPNSEGRGPILDGLYGSRVSLQSGAKVVADESYLRESIVNPNAKMLVGYKPLMPTFAGQIGEEGILQLIAYIKSLEGSERSGE